MKTEPSLWGAVVAAVLLSVILRWKEEAAAPAPSPTTASASGARPFASPVAERSSPPAVGSTPTVTAKASSTVAPSSQQSVPTPPSPRPTASEICPADMVAVLDDYCPMVAHRCARWLGADPRRKQRRRDPADRRCARYRNEVICEGRPARLAFCIDRYEYPNLAGVKPVVLVTLAQARKACRQANKRLCTRQEWVQACEGRRRLPYPYGIAREHGVCNVDRMNVSGTSSAWAEPRLVSLEVQRVDRRMPAGSMPRCISPYGVLAMTGNVAEWVEDRSAEARRDGTEAQWVGGHWGRVPATCRARKTPRSPNEKRVDTGFRCCADTTDGQPARRMLGVGRRLPYRRQMVASKQKR